MLKQLQATRTAPKRKPEDTAEVAAAVNGPTNAKRLRPEQTASVQDDDVPALVESSKTIAGESSGTATDSAEKESKEEKITDDQLVASPLNEDYGLLGCGAIPLPVDAASYSAHDSVRCGTNNPSNNSFDFVSYPIPSDAEEINFSVLNYLDHGMASVLLFVKKRPPQAPLSMYGRQMYALPRTAHDLASGGPLPIAPMPINGDDQAKKFKKRSNQGPLAMAPPTAFTRVAGSPVPPHAARTIPHAPLPSSRKGDYRHQVLVSYQGRQRMTGLTMFDSVAYRIAAIRVERRVMERLERLMWKSTLTYDAGPGLPIQLKDDTNSSLSEHRSWMNIAKELAPGSSTGDMARMQAKSQELALKRSYSSPCRVDFGPFEAGFLASPSGMVGISTPRSRVGVSLPMGVKIVQVGREQSKARWSPNDDKLLQHAAKKFGMNWPLVASALSGFEGVVINDSIPNVESVIPSVARSARQCRDRWQRIARAEPSLASAVRNSERSFREDAKLSVNEITDSNVNEDDHCELLSAEGISILCKNSFVRKETTTTESSTEQEKSEAKKSREETEKENDTKEEKSEDVEMVDSAKPKPQKRTRRSFAAISMAKAKKQVIPITIPGVAAGQPPNQPVSSHPSHMQSVQSSRYSTMGKWSNGNVASSNFGPCR